MQGHDEIVWAVEVSGARLFSASADKTIRVWDIESRRCEQVQTGRKRAPLYSQAASVPQAFLHDIQAELVCRPDPCGAAQVASYARLHAVGCLPCGTPPRVAARKWHGLNWKQTIRKSAASLREAAEVGVITTLNAAFASAGIGGPCTAGAVAGGRGRQAVLGVLRLHHQGERPAQRSCAFFCFSPAIALAMASCTELLMGTCSSGARGFTPAASLVEAVPSYCVSQQRLCPHVARTVAMWRDI